MTVLNLTRLWINRVDTGDAISGASGRDRVTNYGMDGEVRKYASGRLRSVTTAGLRINVPRSLVALDFATKEKLVTWLGLNVQVRDHRGNKWFGVFYGVDVTDYMAPGLYAATITLLSTTTVEGV